MFSLWLKDDDVSRRDKTKQAEKCRHLTEGGRAPLFKFSLAKQNGDFTKRRAAREGATQNELCDNPQHREKHEAIF